MPTTTPASPSPSALTFDGLNTGQRVPRPRQASLLLSGELAPGHTLWAGYQQLRGDRLIIQAAPCAITGNRTEVRCADIYLGNDEHDQRVFRVFVADADRQATATLEEWAQKAPPGRGGNTAHEALPLGAAEIVQVENIRLSGETG
ncbi:hypothetical protein [Cryptosporangium sp. NPDC051539]|uniref:hypothetical protein n=1 Tax=Cryptosporangium sp. NPDC051539 TaxID=3363962 RepID=UPI0037A015D5